MKTIPTHDEIAAEFERTPWTRFGKDLRGPAQDDLKERMLSNLAHSESHKIVPIAEFLNIGEDMRSYFAMMEKKMPPTELAACNAICNAAIPNLARSVSRKVATQGLLLSNLRVVRSLIALVDGIRKTIPEKSIMHTWLAQFQHEGDFRIRVATGTQVDFHTVFDGEFHLSAPFMDKSDCETADDVIVRVEEWGIPRPAPASGIDTPCINIVGLSVVAARMFRWASSKANDTWELERFHFERVGSVAMQHHRDVGDYRGKQIEGTTRRKVDKQFEELAEILKTIPEEFEEVRAHAIAYLFELEILSAEGEGYTMVDPEAVK